MAQLAILGTCGGRQLSLAGGSGTRGTPPGALLLTRSYVKSMCVDVSFGLGGVFVEEEGAVDDVGEAAAEES